LTQEVLTMSNVTVVAIDDMDGLHEGLMRRARAELGVTGWGMQVLTLPPNWDGYPLHNHAADAYDPDQEEVYVPLEGSGRLLVDGEEHELRPGVMARLGPGQLRKIVPGNDGIRFLALGGKPGAFTPSAWTELGAEPPGV
jgi:hypothetical protein